MASGFGARRIANDGRCRVGWHLCPSDQRIQRTCAANTSTSRRGGPLERHAITAGTPSRAGRGRHDWHRSDSVATSGSADTLLTDAAHVRSLRRAPAGGRRFIPAGCQTVPATIGRSHPRAAIATLVRLLGDPDAGADRGMGPARACRTACVVDGATAPLLLDWWARQPRRSEPIFAALGRRGEWLASLNADWQKPVATRRDSRRCRRRLADRQECGTARDPDVRPPARSGPGTRARRIDAGRRRRQRPPAVPRSAAARTARWPTSPSSRRRSTTEASSCAGRPPPFSPSFRNPACGSGCRKRRKRWSRSVRRAGLPIGRTRRQIVLVPPESFVAVMGARRNRAAAAGGHRPESLVDAADSGACRSRRVDRTHGTDAGSRSSNR